jgi:hypothetical protein
MLMPTYKYMQNIKIPELLGFWTSSIIRYSKNQTTRFENWIFVRSQVRETPTLLGPSEKANLNHWTTNTESESYVTTDGESASLS